jgi:soluble lytic murein transglycosylase-like protein
MDEELPMRRYSILYFRWMALAFVVLMIFPSCLHLAQNQACMLLMGPDSEYTYTMTESVTGTSEGMPELDEAFGGSRAERVYHPIIVKAAGRYKVDPALVKAIIMVESSYNPNAVSRKGAKGLMQLMPRTAASLGVEDIFNPEHNIDAGVRYFSTLLNQFNGDTRLALAAYNAGSRKVRKYDGIPPFKATQLYVKKVFEYYNYYKEKMIPATNNV